MLELLSRFETVILYLKLCLLALCVRENAVYAEERECEKQRVRELTCFCLAREFKGKPKA